MRRGGQTVCHRKGATGMNAQIPLPGACIRPMVALFAEVSTAPLRMASNSQLLLATLNRKR